MVHRELVKEPLLRLCDRWVQSEGEMSGHPDLCVKTSSDISLSQTPECSSGTDLQCSRDSLPQTSTESDVRKFRNSTLLHLVHPEQFDSFLKEQGSAIGAFLCGVEKNRKDFTVSSGDSAMFSPNKKRRTNRNLDQDKEVNPQTLGNSDKNSQSDIASYKNLIEGIVDVKNKCTMVFDVEANHLCVSYSWLLKLCSDIILCDVDELREEVAKVEMRLLLDPSDMLSQTLRNLCKKLKMPGQKNSRHVAYTKRYDLFSKHR